MFSELEGPLKYFLRYPYNYNLVFACLKKRNILTCENYLYRKDLWSTIKVCISADKK